MKSILVGIVFFTLTTAVLSEEMQCNVYGESNIVTCNDVASDVQDVVNCDELPTTDDHNIVNSFAENKPSINFCQNNMLYGGEKASKKETQKQEKELRKMCKKKAGEYKRAVARQLLGDFKLGQFVQAALSSKKKIIRKSKKNKKEVFDIKQEISPSEIGNMTKEEFSQYMMGKIRQKVPNIDEVISATQSRQVTTANFSEQESFPMSIVIQSKKGESCLVDVADFPNEEPFTPSECELCKDSDLQNNFSNDCSYMVSSDLTEIQARKMVGAGKKDVKGKDSHCNNEMQGISNDMSEIQQTADRLCNIAKEGLEPQFEIKTSRNLFQDYTQDLAQKRGEFTQAYLYENLQKNCQFDELPDWLKSRESFNQKVKLVYPEYKRVNNVKGDYGPNPYAMESERTSELKSLDETLQFEMAEYNTELRSISEKNKVISQRLAALHIEIYGDKKKQGLQQHYTKMTQEIKKADLRVIQDQQVALTQLSQQAHLALAEKNKLQQEESDNNKRIEALNRILSSPKYGKENGQFVLNIQLQKFYSDKDERGMTPEFRSQWDETLFNQFKMARISGKTAKINAFGIDEEMMTPELSLMLKSLVEVQTFTCVLEPITTKKTTLKGVLTAPLKILTAATLPVIGVVGLGAVIAATPITTGISLFCEGCREPGTTPPILKFGNLFHLNLSKPSRKAAWKSAKGFVNSYVNWGGLLKVNDKKLYTKHELDRFGRRSKQKAYSDMDEDEQENMLDVFMDDIKNTERDGCVSAPRGSEKMDGGGVDIPVDVNATTEQ